MATDCGRWKRWQYRHKGKTCYGLSRENCVIEDSTAVLTDHASKGWEKVGAGAATLSTELKAIISLEVDATKYLDLLLWYWNKFLEQSSTLGQSEVAKRYGIRALSFHSFARKGDSVPLIS